MLRSGIARPAWPGFIAFTVLFFATPAQATVTVANCGGVGSDFDTDCSLAELLDRSQGMPSITIDETVFENFVWSDGFVIGSALGPHSQVRVLGIDSRPQPGVRFTDMGTAWHRVANLQLHLALSTLQFDIRRTQGAGFPVLGRNMFASFGEIAWFDPLDPEATDAVFIKDRMRLLDAMGVVMPFVHNEASVQCFASEEGHDVGAGPQPSCRNTTRRDSHTGTPRLRSAPQPQNPWTPWHYYRADMDFQLGAEPFLGEAELNEFIYQLELYTVAQALELPDINGNGRADVGALLEGAGVTVEVREGADHNLLLKRMAYFDANHRPVGAVAIPDADGDHSDELAVLATRLSDGRAVVEIRNLDPAVAENPRQIEFRAGNTAVGITWLRADIDGDGVAEIAVLSSDANGRGLVEVVDAFGPRNLTGIWLQANLNPLDIEAVDDSDANGVPEVAVLAMRTDGRTAVEVANADGSLAHNVILFRPGEPALDMSPLSDNDGNGVGEVAVLVTTSAGIGIIDKRNVYGAAQVRRIGAGPAASTPLQIRSINDADNDGTQELAVLAIRSTDGRAAVRVVESTGLVRANDIWFPPTFFAARSLAVVDDADGNGVTEVGVLLLRTLDGRIPVTIRNVTGPSGPATGTSYFFVP